MTDQKTNDALTESRLNERLDMFKELDGCEELETDWELKTPNIRLLSIPRGKFNPFTHGNGFSPYESSLDVWVLQVRKDKSNDDWVNIPVVKYIDV